MTALTSWLEAFWVGMAVHLWQTALFLAVLAAIAHTLRGTSSRLLSMLYWTGILKLLLPLPLIGPLSDRALGALTPAAAAGAGESGWGAVQLFMVPLSVEPGAPASTPWLPALTVALTALWLGGTSCCVLRRLKKRALHAENPPPAALLDAIRDAGLDPERVRTSPDTRAPYVHGAWRPVVVLPEGLAGELERDELRAVLIHEREHLERRDPLRYAMLGAVRAPFWFYPPLWWLTRRIRETTEMACDEAVVRAGLPAVTYCRSLARTVSLGLGGTAPSAVGILGHRATFLRRRLERIRSGRRFEAMFSHRLTVAAAAALAFAVSVLPVTTTPTLSASENAETATGMLDGLAGADTPVMLSFHQVQLGKLLGAIGKASGVEFRVDEAITMRPVTIEASTMPLKNALELLASRALIRYRLVDERTVEVSPVFLAGQEDVTLPALIRESKVNPVYPEQAREQRLEARVILQAIVKADGTVDEVELLSSSSDLAAFGEAAIAAVEQWRYEPATRDGQPVDVYFTIRIDFALDPDRPKDEVDQ